MFVIGSKTRNLLIACIALVTTCLYWFSSVPSRSQLPSTLLQDTMPSSLKHLKISPKEAHTATVIFLHVSPNICITMGPTHFAYWFRVWAIVVCLSKLNKLQILIQLFRPWVASYCQDALELIPKCEMDTSTCPYSPRLLKPRHGYAFLVRHSSP